MLAHAQRQGLDALQDVKRVRRAHRRAEIAEALGTGAHHEGRRPEFLGEIETVITGIGLRKGRKPCAPLPVEAPRINQNAADRDAVTAEPFCRRVHDDIGAMLEGTKQRRRGEGVVDHQRQAGGMRDLRDRGHVEHLKPGISERLREDQPCLRADRRAKRVEIARRHKAGRDAEAGQGVREEVVRTAIDRGGRDDMPALPHQRRDREMQRRLTARGADRTDAALERGEALLEDRDGRRCGCKCVRPARD